MKGALDKKRNLGLLPHGFQGRVATGTGRMDGKRKTPALSAVAAGEGRSTLPGKNNENGSQFRTGDLRQDLN